MKNKYKNILTKDFLYEEYIINKKSITQIAKDNNIVSCVTVYNYLKKFNIERIKNYTKELLYQEYIIKKNVPSKIAKKLKYTTANIYYLLRKFNIKIRSCSEARIGKLNPNYGGKFYGIHYSRFGKDNPNYKDGRTKLLRRIYQSKKYKKWRSDVYKRDNFICQDCLKHKYNLEVHHNYISFVMIYEIFKIMFPKRTFKQVLNFTMFWNIENGITLCKKCHLKRHPKKRGKDGKYQACLHRY